MWKRKKVGIVPAFRNECPGALLSYPSRPAGAGE